MRLRLVLYVLLGFEVLLVLALARGLRAKSPAERWPGCDIAESLDNGPWALPECQRREA